MPPIEQYRGDQPYGPAAPVRGGPSGGRGKFVALGAAAVAVIAAGVGVGAVTAGRSEDSVAAGGSTPSMVSALTTGESAPTTKRSSARDTTAEPRPNGTPADIDPIVPGFQAVAVPNRSAAYDVPADWRVAPEGSVGGFGEPPEAVVGNGLATDGEDYCPGSTRTVAFITGSETADPAAAAAELGTKAATVAYAGSRDVRSGVPQPLASVDGSQQGMLVETNGTIAAATPGCATEFSVYTYAVPGRTGSIVMVLAADTGVPDAVDIATAQRILSSIRPLKD